MEGETAELPEFYARKIRRKLGFLWEQLPKGAVMHEHQAYLQSQPPLSIAPVILPEPLPLH